VSSKPYSTNVKAMAIVTVSYVMSMLQAYGEVPMPKMGNTCFMNYVVQLVMTSERWFLHTLWDRVLMVN